MKKTTIETATPATKTRTGLAAAILAGAAVLTLGACNTVQGAGEDIQSVGEEGEDAINGR